MDFHRQPEWQQNADRHSYLIDPVLTVRPISRFDYTARKPMSAIDHALVFTTARGEYDAFLPPHRPTRSQAATRRYTSVLEVDTGSHNVRLDLELPSDDDAFSFGVVADLTWQVTDPVRFVASRERHVPERLTREFHAAARPVSRRFPIEDSRDAEEAVLKAVGSGGFAEGIGVLVTCTVRLRLDDGAISHRRRKRELRYETEILDPTHAYRMQAARQQHELEALQMRQQHELMAQKIDFYRYHLSHGGVAAWALHLAAHPEDTHAATSGIRHDQLSLIQSQLELISGDTLEDYQKAESAKHVLPLINDLIQQGATTTRPAPPQPGGHPQVLPPGAVPPQQLYGVQDGGYPHATAGAYDPGAPGGYGAGPVPPAGAAYGYGPVPPGAEPGGGPPAPPQGPGPAGGGYPPPPEAPPAAQPPTGPGPS